MGQVDRIISHDARNNTYLVKWQGLNYVESTWENADDLKDDQVRLQHPCPPSLTPVGQNALCQFPILGDSLQFKRRLIK